MFILLYRPYGTEDGFVFCLNRGLYGLRGLRGLCFLCILRLFGSDAMFIAVRVSHALSPVGTLCL